MSNHIKALLEHWQLNKLQHQWVLATIIDTEGSSYRKAGAMMLINDLGQYFGLLSGGCLESDIMRQARRCWDDGLNRIIKYDMREEEDLAWQLGIGCGGMVQILLQPVDVTNDYLQLEQLSKHLKNNNVTAYKQVIDINKPDNQVIEALAVLGNCQTGRYKDDNSNYFIQIIKPSPVLGVFGGGIDAKPVVAIAAELGWQVELFDPRSSYAREAYFSGATGIHRQPFKALSNETILQELDAALVLTHNISLDAQALEVLQKSSVKYVGLLGPLHRTERVLAEINMNKSGLNYPLANPVGLRLGGELPESIALSMLAEVHAFLEKTDGLSISQVLVAHA